MDVEQVSLDCANQILARGHYLGPLKASPRFCIASKDRQAVAVYSPPIASPINNTFKSIGDGAVDLSRLWRAGDATFPTSMFLAASLRWLKMNTNLQCVFSYADPAQVGANGKAHVGIIYQATNWTYLGTSRVTDKWQTYEGEIISSPVCYRRYRTKSRTYLQGTTAYKANFGTRDNPDWRTIKGPGLQLIPGEPKHLYVYPLAMRLKKLLPMIAGRYATKPARDAHKGLEFR